jgi:esterase/lipase superfamily enzyme
MHFVRSVAGQILILLILCVEAVAQTPRGTWDTLGTLNLATAGAPATLRLPENNKRTTAIRLVAQGREVVIERLTIEYATGRVDHIDYTAQPLVLTANAPSDAIAVREVEQIVESVSFQFRSAAAKPSGQLTVAGSVVGEFKPDATTSASQTRGSGLASKFVELDVYYATTRQRADDRVKNDVRMASFNGEQGAGVTLGKAVVTVPKERDVGTIPRPYLGFVLLFRKEDPSKEFTLAKVDVLDGKGFQGGISEQAKYAERFKRQALVFVHGYWVAFDDALYHAAQLAHDMAFDGPVVAFSWASRGNAASYFYDRETARGSSAALRDLLAELAKNPAIEAVNVVAHSMGNDPLIEVLKEQVAVKEQGGRPLPMKLKEVVFASPDVPRAALEKLSGKLRSQLGAGGTLYASGSDIALKGSNIVAHERAGHVSAQVPPLIVRDVETIDVTQASWMFSLNHSTFSERRHIIDDLELLFSKGQRPPHERYKVFRPVDIAGGQRFWRYER